jgi:hypothetical protein
MTFESGGESMYFVAAAWMETVAGPAMSTPTASNIIGLLFIMDPFTVELVAIFIPGV